MSIFINKLVTFTIIVLHISCVVRSATISSVQKSVTEVKQSSITDTYLILQRDMQWFFQRLEYLTDIIERMLPSVNPLPKEQNSTFVENTRDNLVIGVHHLVGIIKEISRTFQESFNTDHLRQLQQLKYVSAFLQDVMRFVKQWFHRMRVFTNKILRLYNYYIPEVLFGRCIGRYIVKLHPDRSFHEYPFLLIGDMYETLIDYINNVGQTRSYATIKNITYDNDDVDFIKENEIPHSIAQEDAYNDAMKLEAQNAYNDYNNASSSNQTNNDETSNFFDFFDSPDSIDTNMDTPIVAANAQKDSWQRCLKIYTAETISRRLRVFFFDM